MSARSAFETFSGSVWLIFFCLSALVVYGIAGHDTYRTLTVHATYYDLKVASTDAARSKGLGGTASLAVNQGMLFVFPNPSQQCFWMQDMHFPLDIVWLDANKTVVHIAEQVPPESYPNTFCPGQSATYVIELNAGEVAKQTIHQGDHLTF
ncbi:MAG TPA: DUF192 domain-containing protein [Patescibacteria group bacterium]|nr:DUF192 domain-containing protein [Patescibacteria group bacterium]